MISNTDNYIKQHKGTAPDRSDYVANLGMLAAADMLDAATLSIAVIVLSTNPRTWQSQILGDDRPFYRCLSGRSTFGLTPTFAT